MLNPRKFKSSINDFSTHIIRTVSYEIILQLEKTIFIEHLLTTMHFKQQQMKNKNIFLYNEVELLILIQLLMGCFSKHLSYGKTFGYISKLRMQTSRKRCHEIRIIIGIKMMRTSPKKDRYITLKTTTYNNLKNVKTAQRDLFQFSFKMISLFYKFRDLSSYFLEPNTKTKAQHSPTIVK